MTQPPIDDVLPPDDRRSMRMARIRGLSGVMAWVCILTAMLLTAAMLIYWSSTPADLLLRHAGLAMMPPAAIGPPVRIGGFLLSMIPLAVLIYGLLAARRCFILFASGQAFSPQAIRGLRSFALGVAVSAALRPPTGALLGLLLSSTSPVHSYSLVVMVGSDTLLALLFAGFVAIIAWVLVEAIEIADENRQFV